MYPTHSSLGAFAFTLSLLGCLIGACSDASEPSGHGDRPEVAVSEQALGLVLEQEAWAIPNDGPRGDGFGASLALSADGTHALVTIVRSEWPASNVIGAPGVLALVRDGESWNVEGVLLEDMPQGSIRQLALSDDGSVALIGDVLDDSAQGVLSITARVFERSGAQWVEASALPQLDVPYENGGSTFGTASFALSGDGNVAVAAGTALDTAQSVLWSGARVFERSGESWSLLTTLTPTGTASFRAFGSACATSLDGGVIAIGAMHDTTAAGSAAGSVRVYERSGADWSETDVLVADNGANDRRFGAALALTPDASRMLVSAIPSPGGGVPEVHVLARSGAVWSAEARLQPRDASHGSFGRTLAITADGAEAWVGSPIGTDAILGTYTGHVRVFARSGAQWSVSANLQASDPEASDAFGHSLALSADGQRALVGAIDDDTPSGIDAGSVRALAWNGSSATEHATITAPPSARYGAFGYTVAMSGDGNHAFIGAPGTTVGEIVPLGRVLVLVRDGSHWSQEASILAADGADDDGFGFDVASNASGDLLLVGAWADDTAAGQDAGSVRVLTRSGSTWTEGAPLLAPNAAAGDRFGTAVAVSADGLHALIVAYGADRDATLDVGAAYAFVRSGDTWSFEAELALPAGVSNHVALDATGSRGVVSAREEYGAYVLDRVNDVWTLEASLPSTASTWRRNVAVSDDGTRVLAQGRIFVRGPIGWLQDATRAPSAPDAAVSALALAPDGQRALFNRDAIRVWNRVDDTWVESTQLTVPTLFSTYDFAFAADGSRVLSSVVSSAQVPPNTVFVHRIDAAPLGDACTHGPECESGFCANDVCCESACGGDSDCMACAQALTGMPDGTCAQVTLAAAPTLVCRAASDGCDAPEVCTGASAACPDDALHVAGHACTAPSCTEGIETPAGTCDGFTAECNAASSILECHPYACGATQCLSACTLDAHCANNRRCDGGSCVPKLAPGDACTRNTECSGDRCIDGYCCASACGGQCEACDVPGREGLCSAVDGTPHGARAACAVDDSSCGGVCDGTHRLACVAVSDESACSDAGAADAGADASVQPEGDASVDHDAGIGAGDAGEDAGEDAAEDAGEHSAVRRDDDGDGASCACRIGVRDTQRGPHALLAYALLGLPLYVRQRRRRQRARERRTDPARASAQANSATP